MAKQALYRSRTSTITDAHVEAKLTHLERLDEKTPRFLQGLFTISLGNRIPHSHHHGTL